MYFWVLLLKINRILSLVQLLYDQNVSKFIINGNCFKKKKKKKITFENLFWRNISIDAKVCTIRNNGIYMANEELKPDIVMDT